MGEETMKITTFCPFCMIKTRQKIEKVGVVETCRCLTCERITSYKIKGGSVKVIGNNIK